MDTGLIAEKNPKSSESRIFHPFESVEFVIGLQTDKIPGLRLTTSFPRNIDLTQAQAWYVNPAPQKRYRRDFSRKERPKHGAPYSGHPAPLVGHVSSRGGRSGQSRDAQNGHTSSKWKSLLSSCPMDTLSAQPPVLRSVS
jgi:hypothetical protein